MTTIRITIGGKTIAGELNNNPTAQDLARQLPVDVTLADFNGVEKVGELPRPLTMDGVPAGADPEINDIGYYRPRSEGCCGPSSAGLPKATWTRTETKPVQEP